MNFHKLAALKSGALLLLASGVPALSAPPDLTNGGVPGDTISTNLGPTGLRGWVYHVRENSSESRQIQVKAVEGGSPASGLLAANDVILGANGTGAAPVNFTDDARRAFADAINDAEVRTPATLQLIRWRSGSTSTVTLTLRTMGAYSATAPYNCPKSALILEEGLQFIQNGGETAGTYSFGTLSLLAGNNTSNPNNPARRTRAQNEARARVPSAAVRAQMMSDQRDTTGMVTWERGHTLIMLAEYYLLTGDAQVLPGIEAYAVNIAKNHSLFGTTGHMFARKNADGSNNGPLGNGYGAVNSTAMPCYLGLLLAKKCGLTNPEIDPAIQRSARTFAYYAGKGAIPYGEMESYWQAHENNGKSGLAAVCFRLEPSRVEVTKFFTRMAIAGASERGEGHTGAFFNYVWSPLGAAVGGEEAAASQFARIRWMLDLNRKWNGAFDYDCLTGEGENSGDTYSDFRMSTAALLTYALPLRQLQITGKTPVPAHALTSTEVAASAAVDNYNPVPRTTDELISDLGNWSPRVQRNAATTLATRTLNSTKLAQITALANDTNGSSRYGACLTLGKISNSTTANARAATLAALLTDPDNHVRFMAADAMRSLPQSAKLIYLNTILTLCSSHARPLLPLVEEDPLQLAHGRLCLLLFNSDGGVIWNNLTGVDRNLLYPAIRAVANHPTGYVRSSLPKIYSMLTQQETLELADAIVESIHRPTPADRMFGEQTETAGIAKLELYNIAEGVPLSKAVINREDRLGVKTAILSTLQAYGGSSTTLEPDPEIVPFLEMLKTNQDTASAAQAVLDAIAADTNPVQAMPLKSLPTISVDASFLTLPANQTMLRATGFDYAKGDSVFTWRKVHGKSHATFTPNGTASAKDCDLLIDGEPGKYLFEVTLSDSRGLTEVSRTVAVTLYNASGSLPPNAPPVANPQSLAVPRGIPVPLVLTGSDPEAYPLNYRILTRPADGALSGTPPNLTYTARSGGVATSDSFTFEVMDSEGQVDDATVSLSIDNSINAGVIAWGAPTNITSPTSVVTQGTLVDSRTGGDDSGTISVNGVNFFPGRILANSGSYYDPLCPNTGSGAGNIALELLLDRISWGGNSFQVTGLTPGFKYLIQIFLCDYRVAERQMILSDTANPPNTVALITNPTGAFGQFVTGTFTAGAGSQTISVTGLNGETPHLNSWQVRLLPDTTPPSPNPPTWAIPPSAVGMHTIRMQANSAYDASGVEYFFEETSGNPGSTDSGWQDSPSYIDRGLTLGTTYTYIVTARDKSSAANETGHSAVQSATTTNTAPTTLVNFDVNTNVGRVPPPGTYTGSGPLGGGTWSSATTPAGSTHNTLYAGSLINSTGAATTLGVSVEYEGAWDTSHLSFIAAAMEPLMSDYILVRAPFPATTIHITGLDPTTTDWTLVLFSGIGQGQGADFTVNGVKKSASDSGTIGATLGENDEYVTFTGTGSGNIAVTWEAGSRGNSTFTGFQLQQIGGEVVNDYNTWAEIYAPADLSDPDGDHDGDGMTNDEERAFGLIPTSGSSANPISVPLNPATGTFNYTRRNPTLTNLTYTVWTSTTLGGWIKDDDAELTHGTPDANGIQTVAVKLSVGLLANPALFVRVSASETAPPPAP